MYILISVLGLAANLAHLIGFNPWCSASGCTAPWMIWLASLGATWFILASITKHKWLVWSGAAVHFVVTATLTVVYGPCWLCLVSLAAALMLAVLQLENKLALRAVIACGVIIFLTTGFVYWDQERYPVKAMAAVEPVNKEQITSVENGQQTPLEGQVNKQLVGSSNIPATPEHEAQQKQEIEHKSMRTVTIPLDSVAGAVYDNDMNLVQLQPGQYLCYAWWCKPCDAALEVACSMDEKPVLVATFFRDPRRPGDDIQKSIDKAAKHGLTVGYFIPVEPPVKYVPAWVVLN